MWEDKGKRTTLRQRVEQGKRGSRAHCLCHSLGSARGSSALAVKFLASPRLEDGFLRYMDLPSWIRLRVGRVWGWIPARKSTSIPCLHLWDYLNDLPRMCQGELQQRGLGFGYNQ